ncbi:hypothetical protein SRHO_G00178090 [Serrasalmus rhombeus]
MSYLGGKSGKKFVQTVQRAIDLSGDPQTPSQTPEQLWQDNNYEGQSWIQNHQINLWHQESPIESQRQATQSVWQQESAPVSTKETLKLQRLRNVSVCEQKCASLLHDLLIKQEIIIEQQRNLIRTVQDLKTTSARENTAACEDTIACDMNQRHLPIEDLPSLMALENDLRSSPDKRKKLVLELGLVGGADIKDTVWRILKQTIKNDLAETVNWRGVNGKTGFQSLQLKNVVTEAVRRNPVCSQATEMEVERVIRRWFHLACDREGGRKRRKVENASGQNKM